MGEFLSRAGLHEAVAIEGKRLRGSGQDEHRAQQLMAVVTHKTPVTLAQRPIDAKTNEIAEARPLLQPFGPAGQGGHRGRDAGAS